MSFCLKNKNLSFMSFCLKIKICLFCLSFQSSAGNICDDFLVSIVIFAYLCQCRTKNCGVL